MVLRFQTFHSKKSGRKTVGAEIVSNYGKVTKLNMQTFSMMAYKGMLQNVYAQKYMDKMVYHGNGCKLSEIPVVQMSIESDCKF